MLHKSWCITETVIRQIHKTSISYGPKNRRPESNLNKESRSNQIPQIFLVSFVFMNALIAMHRQKYLWYITISIYIKCPFMVILLFYNFVANNWFHKDSRLGGKTMSKILTPSVDTRWRCKYSTILLNGITLPCHQFKGSIARPLLHASRNDECDC